MTGAQMMQIVHLGLNTLHCTKPNFEFVHSKGWFIKISPRFHPISTPLHDRQPISITTEPVM